MQRGEERSNRREREREKEENEGGGEIIEDVSRGRTHIRHLGLWIDS